MPGRFIYAAQGGHQPQVPWWEAPGGAYKALTNCKPCPGLDACRDATPLPPAEFDALPNATFHFTCGLVYETSGYINYVYSVLVDDTAHWASGGQDPAFNSVGQEAHVFFVAKSCAGALYSSATGSVSCTPLDPKGRDSRDIVRTRVRFTSAGNSTPNFCRVTEGNTTYVDYRTVPADLSVPAMQVGTPPTPGARVYATNPNWSPGGGGGSQAYFALYLPPEWEPTGDAPALPVVVELAGNGPFDDPYGDVSTGRPENSSLGYGITAGRGAIWVSMPMLTADGAFDGTEWWGCPSNAAPAGAPPTVTSNCTVATTNATLAVAYIESTVRYVLGAFNGDASRVVLVGFSRGAIGVNYLGLFSDSIASLWAGSVAYAHYDGQPMDVHWPYPAAGPPASYDRLRRLGSRPQFICSELSGATGMTRPYIDNASFLVNATYASTGFCNHNDKWALRPSPARTQLRAWYGSLIGTPTTPPA